MLNIKMMQIESSCMTTETEEMPAEDLVGLCHRGYGVLPLP